MSQRWDYPTAFSSWGPEEKAAIERVIKSNQFTMDREVLAAEQEFAKFHKKLHAIMVNSGSSANLVAVAALFHVSKNKLMRGDKVAVPALAWPTTYAPLVQYGLDLVLCDADATWNMDRKELSLEKSLKGVRLIMAAHILGNPCSIDVWMNTAANLNARTIEDNCESFGASVNGKLCGTFADLSTFSFFYSHQISAIEGGMILTDDDELATLCRLLRNHGWTKGVEKPQSFSDEYNFKLMGYNVRPLEMHAAILREQLKKTEQFRIARQKNWEYAKQALSRCPVVFPSTTTVANSKMNPFGIAFCVPNEKLRDYLAGKLRAEGIDCRPPVGGSFGRKPYGNAWEDQKTGYADEIDRTGIMIGNAPYGIELLIDRAARVVRDTL